MIVFSEYKNPTDVNEFLSAVAASGLKSQQQALRTQLIFSSPTNPLDKMFARTISSFVALVLFFPILVTASPVNVETRNTDKAPSPIDGLLGPLEGVSTTLPALQTCH